ncbi:MAG TPA: hypothetical protein VLZ89_10125 [Anaerolineales bacterium]|nr:hypothetical protein [Anaerolineales bacterium]
MSAKALDRSSKLDQGRLLARRLYDLKIRQLEELTEQDSTSYLAEYPRLGKTEFRDVVRQVIEAKKAEQTQVGWFSIPHDITVLVFVAFACFTNLNTAIIAGIGVLVLFESIFHSYFNPRLYPALSFLVWFTYPAYVLLGWVLIARGMTWYWAVVVVAALWGGTYLAGLVARLPMQLTVQARAEAEKRKTREPSGRRK